MDILEVKDWYKSSEELIGSIHELKEREFIIRKNQ
jgi:hypothetical protein